MSLLHVFFISQSLCVYQVSLFSSFTTIDLACHCELFLIKNSSNMSKILVKSTALISFADTVNRHKLVGFATPTSHLYGLNISEVCPSANRRNTVFSLDHHIKMDYTSLWPFPRSIVFLTLTNILEKLINTYKFK